MGGADAANSMGNVAHAKRAIETVGAQPRCEWGAQWTDDESRKSDDEWWKQEKQRVEGLFLAIAGTDMYMSVYEVKSGRAIFATKHREGTPSVCFSAAPLQYKGAEALTDKPLNAEHDQGVRIQSSVFPLLYVTKDTSMSDGSEGVEGRGDRRSPDTPNE